MRTRFSILALTIISTISFTSITQAAGLSVTAAQKFNVNANRLNMVGDVNNAGTLQISTGGINLGGNWTNTGAFNAGTGSEVEFTGSAPSTIKGENHFFNFTCTQPGKQLSFEADKTQTIDGAWTLTGASGGLIALRSTVAGTQWMVNPQGTRNISFVDVADANNISSTMINAVSSIDSGNNTGWFKPTAITLAYFHARAGKDGRVTLTWETATEVDNAGFNLYRAKTKDRNYKKINDNLIPAQGNATSGASYRYVDTPPAKGTYYYKLEDVDYNGVSTMHGPEKVKVKRQKRRR